MNDLQRPHNDDGMSWLAARTAYDALVCMPAAARWVARAAWRRAVEERPRHLKELLAERGGTPGLPWMSPT